MYLAFRACRSGIERERAKAQQLSELHLATIEALALAIDAKDQTQPHHIQRVQAYATGLARALGMSETDVQAVKTAALLHDIGKLAIPDHILAKPGPLTAEEFQKVRVHPEVGAAILHSVPFPYPVAPLILSHHERWDGRGYPAGLKEDEIPLGARVVGVVEYFDALTSDRPYHKAISHDEGAGASEGRGRQGAGPARRGGVHRNPAGDCGLIRAGGIPHRQKHAATADGRRIRGPLPRRDSGRARRCSTISPRQTGKSTALYQIAQTMGTTLAIADTMALVSSKLSNVVPFSACALFLYSEQTEQLHCRFATGTDAELIQQLTLRSGQGLTGWVARNRRPLINARPSADLEAMNSNAPTVLQSALVCPLLLGERLIGTLAVYHTDLGVLRRGPCAAAGAGMRAGCGRHTQRGPFRADPGGFADRPPDRTAEYPRGCSSSSRGSWRGQSASTRRFRSSSWTSTGSRRSTTPTVTVSATGRCGRLHVRCARRSATTTCASRYGGDEFIVVLSGCDSDEAENKRVELQNAVSRVVLEVEPGRLLSLSISAGTAVYPKDGDTYEALLGRADRRMYRDKSNRRALLSHGA